MARQSKRSASPVKTGGPRISVGIWLPGESHLETLFDADDPAQAERWQAGSQFYDSVKLEAKEYGKARLESHGPWAGDHLTLIVLWAAGNLTWDALKVGAKWLWLKFSQSRDLKYGLEADTTGVMFLAWEEARRRNPDFRTAYSLTQCLADGESERSEDGTYPYTGFPTGVFLFRFPDLAAAQTHVVEIRSDGTVESHGVRDYLTKDAEAYLAAERDVSHSANSGLTGS